MKLPVNPGEKFALIALNAATTITDPFDLGNGFHALPGGSLELPERWRGWIGAFKSDIIERAGLVILAKRQAREPDVRDADDDVLGHQVNNLYWGLLASGQVRIADAGTLIGGTNGEDGLTVKRVGDVYCVEPIPGMLPDEITAAHLTTSASLAMNLADLFATPGMLRLKLAVGTFMRAFSGRDLGERVHQFVRSVDSITRAWNKNQFKERCGTLVMPADLPGCRELYMIRSNAEHFHPPDAMLPPLPRAQARIRDFSRAAEAEVLARHCMARLIETPEVWPEFADDRADSFWRYDDPERERRWGPRLDLASAMAGFNPEWLPPVAT